MARPPEFDHNSMSMYDNVDQKKVQKESPRMRQLRQRLEANNSGVEVSSVGGGFAAAKDTDRTSPELNTAEVKIDNRSRRQAFVQDLDQDLHSEVVMHSKNLASNLSDLATAVSHAANQDVDSNTTEEFKVGENSSGVRKSGAFDPRMDVNVEVVHETNTRILFVPKNISAILSNDAFKAIVESGNQDLRSTMFEIADKAEQQDVYEVVAELMQHVNREEDVAVVDALKKMVEKPWIVNRDELLAGVNYSSDGVTTQEFKEYVQTLSGMFDKAVQHNDYMLNTFGEPDTSSIRNVLEFFTQYTGTVAKFNDYRPRVTLPYGQNNYGGDAFDEHPAFVYEPKTIGEIEEWNQLNLQLQSQASSLNETYLNHLLDSYISEETKNFDFANSEDPEKSIEQFMKLSGGLGSIMSSLYYVTGSFADSNIYNEELQTLMYGTLRNVSSKMQDALEQGFLGDYKLSDAELSSLERGLFDAGSAWSSRGSIDTREPGSFVEMNFTATDIDYQRELSRLRKEFLPITEFTDVEHFNWDLTDALSYIDDVQLLDDFIDLANDDSKSNYDLADLLYNRLDPENEKDQRVIEALNQIMDRSGESLIHSIFAEISLLHGNNGDGMAFPGESEMLTLIDKVSDLVEAHVQRDAYWVQYRPEALESESPAEYINERINNYYNPQRSEQPKFSNKYTVLNWEDEIAFHPRPGVTTPVNEAVEALREQISAHTEYLLSLVSEDSN